jgi:histone-lysine N-methyltransferase SUV39H
MRAPQPNVRPSVPDSPSTNLSPSKQLAQKKHEVLIPGEVLETWRVDLVNSMPESYRNSPGIRVVFQAFMDQMMRENEPSAPEIPIENEVDKQPCPPWEFVYCNRVLYGENVPRPDRDALEGCDCLGPCNPENKDCACVRRQEAYFAQNENVSEFSGFAFSPNGTIKYHGGAVFGCNSKCTCDPECQNKVSLIYQ